ncbi:zinc finger protein ZFP2-like isoform X2 [Watersipora subatra]|uniref:zinc finger protein ZFP2-like isoform X2 n=1 Tax=Watersipora subatra TaxID=2589382 RepID=UPI00355C6100
MAADIFQEIVSQFVIECEKNGYSGVVYLHHVLTKQVIVQCSGEGSGKLAVAQIAAGKRVLVSEEPTLTEPLIPEPNSVCLESTSQPIYPENVEIKAEGVDHSEDNSEKDDSEVFDFDAYIKQHPLAGAVDDTQLQATAGDEDQTGADVHDGTHHLSSSSHAAGDPGTGLSGSDHTNIFTSFSHTAFRHQRSFGGFIRPRGRPSMFPPVSNTPSATAVASVADGTPFLCHLCNMTFKVGAYYTRHMRRHTGDKPYRCGACNKCFIAKGDLTRHMRVHTGEKPYQCKICNTSFSQSGSLKIHKRIHSKEKPYHCTSCSMSFCRATNYRKHMKSHTEFKPLKCPTCSAVFIKEEELRIHQKMHQQPKAYSCEVCTKPFASRSELARHLRIHTEALGSPSDSDNQRVTKDKDCVHRPDASSEIEMKISEALSKRNADQGKDSHLSPLLGSPTLVAQNLNLLPFAAPKDFRVMEQLPERPNCCDICNKSFTTKGDLTRHMRVHTGEKPYTCGICKTAFSQSGNLKTHMRLYSREKPYECKECNRSFCGTTNYNKHMKHHLNGKQCACSTCKPQFPSITRVAQLEGLTT